MDIHQFFLGNSFDAHTYFGAHVTEEGVVFRTLAPNAAAVDLIWATAGKKFPWKRLIPAAYILASFQMLSPG